MKLPASLHLRYLYFSLLVVGIVLITRFTLPQMVHNDIWVIFGFIAGLYYLLGLMANWLNSQSSENFMQIKLLGMLIRILSFLGFIGIFTFLKTENIILFIVNSFLIFLSYLIFDIYSFISTLRPNSK